jgi:hypothetical protein
MAFSWHFRGNIVQTDAPIENPSPGRLSLQERSDPEFIIE